MNVETFSREVRRAQKTNTQKIIELLGRDFDLSHLEMVLDPEVSEIYRRLIPRHAELCELNQRRKLTQIERCDLAVSYASLYPTFGHEGIITVTAHWLATRPNRQARNN